jgi:hypothetical protein
MIRRIFRSLILTRRGFAGATLALVAACSPAPAPIAQSAGDPSNPSAPEGVRPTVSTTEAPSKPSAGTEGVVYACPMHPDVTSHTPGVCPKCNMKLVPTK